MAEARHGFDFSHELLKSPTIPKEAIRCVLSIQIRRSQSTGHLFDLTINRIEIIHPGVLDLYRNVPPTFFQIINDDTQLVNGPAGHIPFQTYASGRFGYAIASTKGRDGDIWWRVYVKEDNYKLRMGWMKKGQVKTIYQH